MKKCLSDFLKLAIFYLTSLCTNYHIRVYYCFSGTTGCLFPIFEVKRLLLQQMSTYRHNFVSNQIIHQSWFGLCFWMPDLFISRF